MAQEYKKLLLKDLCARIPYGVIVELRGSYEDGEKYVRDEEFDAPALSYLYDDEVSIKPYLRPMSSLIEKELDECRATCKYRQVGQSVLDCATPETIDYLISHHFDYRGLIPMGLALKASEGMYETE